MKAVVIVVLFLIAVSVAINAQESEAPMDGLYESVANGGAINGKQAGYTPWLRIGVDSYQRRVLLLFDNDADESLDDEEIQTIYAKFYSDGITWGIEGGGMAVFVWQVENKRYQYSMMIGSDLYTFHMVLVEAW